MKQIDLNTIETKQCPVCNGRTIVNDDEGKGIKDKNGEEIIGDCLFCDMKGIIPKENNLVIPADRTKLVYNKHNFRGNSFFWRIALEDQATRLLKENKTDDYIIGFLKDDNSLSEYNPPLTFEMAKHIVSNAKQYLYDFNKAQSLLEEGMSENMVIEYFEDKGMMNGNAKHRLEGAQYAMKENKEGISKNMIIAIYYIGGIILYLIYRFFFK